MLQYREICFADACMLVPAFTWVGKSIIHAHTSSVMLQKVTYPSVDGKACSSAWVCVVAATSAMQKASVFQTFIVLVNRA